MHDFCFTIPYGLIMVCGGIIGYAKKGSTASLAGGLGTGLVLILAGYLSLNAFHKRKNSYLALILETACAATLTWVMGQRYAQTSKIMPAGVVAGISLVYIIMLYCKVRRSQVVLRKTQEKAFFSTCQLLVGISCVVMTLFYLYKIGTGGNHFSAKAE